MGEPTEIGTREQVLDLIVEKGPVTATVIAKILDLTTAAHHHFAGRWRNRSVSGLLD